MRYGSTGSTRPASLFYVETLADLNKQMRAGRTPEQVVGNIAFKTPVIASELNVHHSRDTLPA